MITVDDIVSTVRDLATEDPNRKASCMYLEAEYNEACDTEDLKEQPCCVFGHALARLDADFYDHIVEFGNTTLINDLLDELTHRGVVESRYGDHYLVEWMLFVQRSQDQGETWASAVYYADSVLPDGV